MPAYVHGPVRAQRAILLLTSMHNSLYGQVLLCRSEHYIDTVIWAKIRSIEEAENAVVSFIVLTLCSLHQNLDYYKLKKRYLGYVCFRV